MKNQTHEEPLKPSHSRRLTTNLLLYVALLNVLLTLPVQVRASCCQILTRLTAEDPSELPSVGSGSLGFLHSSGESPPPSDSAGWTAAFWRRRLPVVREEEECGCGVLCAVSTGISAASEAKSVL